METKRTILLSVALLGGVVVALTLALLMNRAPVALAAPGVLYVAPGGNCSGASPCYATMQAAVDAANDGDVVKVAAGTYVGVQNTPRLNTSFFTATQMVAITKSVTIQGGYTTTDWDTSSPNTNRTILDAERQGRVFYVTGSNANCTIEGLHITNGDATGLGGPGGDAGGGIFDNAVTILRHNKIYSNAADYGGGVYLYYGFTSLEMNTISDNIANNDGGGLYLRLWYGYAAEVRGNTIARNRANSFHGGGVYFGSGEVTFSENTVVSNTASYGAGAYVFEGNAITLSGNNFVTNTAKRAGGGVYVRSMNVTLNDNVFSDNVVTDNHIAAGGGGLHLNYSSVTLANNMIVGNRTNTKGNGVYIDGSSALLLHTTVAHNSGGDGSAIYLESGSTASLTNTILVSHTIGVNVSAGNTVTLEATLWGSGAWANTTDWEGAGTIITGAVNMWDDPGFARNGDYHITEGSAAVDAGVDAGVEEDIDGQARPFGPAPDLGADEFASVGVTVQAGTGVTITAVARDLTTTVAIPSGAVSEDTDIVYTYAGDTDKPDPAGYGYADHAFDLDAYRGGDPVSDFEFDTPVTITIHYTDDDVDELDEDTLELGHWNDAIQVWEDAACDAYDRHPDENWMAVPVHFVGSFAVFGEEGAFVYLPLVLRSN